MHNRFAVAEPLLQLPVMPERVKLGYDQDRHKREGLMVLDTIEKVGCWSLSHIAAPWIR